MDSPFDAVFGADVYQDYSPNKLVIYNGFSDAVICAVQSDPPYKTIRNEYIEVKNGFVMPEMPGGNYYLKMYTGKDWDMNKKIPDGRKLGGFRKEEGYYRLRLGPYHLCDKKKKNSDTNTCDTIFINPMKVKLDTLTSAEFFNPGQK